MSTELILQAEGLKKYYKSFHAVEDVSLDVHRGEIFGFLGPNGAGKSTTIGMLLGIIYPTAGKITLMGQEVTPLHTQPLRRVGALIEAPALTPYLSARANLKQLSLLYSDIPSTRIDQVLELVSLSGADAGKKRVKHFSTGMKQRLGVAMALFNQPELLILDEPTNGLDPAGMHEFRVLLHTLKEQGMTVFLSSHLLHEVEQICDHVAVIQRGRVITQKAVSELTQSSNETVRLTLADPKLAAQALQTHLGIKHIQVEDQYVDIQGISSEEALACLIQQNLVPKEVSIVRPDLESVFLELTKSAS